VVAEIEIAAALNPIRRSEDIYIERLLPPLRHVVQVRAGNAQQSVAAADPEVMRVVLENLVHIRFRQAAGFRVRRDLAARYPADAALRQNPQGALPVFIQVHHIGACQPLRFGDGRQEPPSPEFLKARPVPTHTLPSARSTIAETKPEAEASPSSFPNTLMRPWLKRLSALVVPTHTVPSLCWKIVRTAPESCHVRRAAGSVRFAPWNQCSTPSSDPAHRSPSRSRSTGQIRSLEKPFLVV
jgi:hypothetical protein